MRIVLLGAPGSGKGTQAQKLAAKYRIPHISTGDLLRAALAAGTPLGLQAKAAMDAGQLVSDEIVLGIIRERLRTADAKKGFILDGFPRNIAQAQSLDIMLHNLGQPLDCGVLMEVDFDALMQRLTGRRTCGNCGTTYNIFTNPPRLDDQCDRCGAGLRHRADDNEVTIGNRLRVYDAQTKPLIDLYRNQGRLETVNGVGDEESVFKRLLAVLEPIVKGTRKPKPLPLPPAKPVKAKSAVKSATSAKHKPLPLRMSVKPTVVVAPKPRVQQAAAQKTKAKKVAGKQAGKKSAVKPARLKKKSARAAKTVVKRKIAKRK